MLMFMARTENGTVDAGNPDEFDEILNPGLISVISCCKVGSVMVHTGCS